MIIRTISQLPKIQDNEYLPNDALFEVSVPRIGNNDMNYISKAVRYRQFATQLNDTVKNSIVNSFNLIDNNDNNINVKNLYENVQLMLHGKNQQGDINTECVLAGPKTFNGKVILTNTDNADFDNTSTTNDKCAATIQTIKTALNGTSTRIGINNNTKQVKFLFNQTNVNESKFAYLEIDDHKKSALPYSGTLVLYGWLADTGVVDTAQCWVALEGKMKDGSWKIIQLQPWIVGARHSSMQYVSFNAMVAQGVQLRIEVGFDLNYQSSSYQLRSNTLVDNTAVQLATNIGPAFIGTLYY